jgi:selenide, water dikinase
VIVGLEGFDDAGVYRITDEVAIVQTVDFFTPVVDDPYWFGQIAAANAFSDIYAMGAVPKTAMNIVGFSPRLYPISLLKEILRGGIEKIAEAGASLLGGHSVDDEEMKYGLCVTGVIHPDKILRNEGAQPGDMLLLTKPLGTGILNTAIKGDMVGEESVQKLITVMATLNNKPAQAMSMVRTHAATDVTGFGLIGHCTEMIKGYIGLELFLDKLPYFEEVVELSPAGFVPGGLFRNQEYYVKRVIGEAEGFLKDILFDPQTSGGLLIALPPDDLPLFEKEAVRLGFPFWVIGRFRDKHRGKIEIVSGP